MSPEALISLFGLLGTLGAGLGVTFLSNKAVREREDVQWEREIGEKRRLERLAALEDFLTVVALVTVATAREDFTEENLFRNLFRVQMRCSVALGEAAQILTLACAEMPMASTGSQEYDRKITIADRLRKEFVELAREETTGT